MHIEDIAAMLGRVPMLAKLDPTRIKLLAFTGQLLRFSPGEYLMRVGDTSDCTFLILEGGVDAVVDSAKGEILLTRAGPNDMVGEMGVLMNVPRTAGVRANSDVRALRITAKMFLRLVSESPEVALDVMRTLAERVLLNSRQVERLHRELDQAAAPKMPYGMDAAGDPN
jgi:CRP/FNR family cyclic AMP-dependent transcriptional regulator